MNIANFVGYLKIGAQEITQNKDEGYFRLYSEPTLPKNNSNVREYNTGELYDQLGVTPKSTLQTFGGPGGKLNKEEFGKKAEASAKSYGGQTYDPEKGTLLYNGIERHGIALGPLLQNPEFNLSSTKILVTDMAYGTCVDISIELNGERYYIPAIIVDVKAHTWPNGIYQTGVAFDGSSESTYLYNIVEWYTTQYMDEVNDIGNKSENLNRFNRDTNIIIYEDHRMYYPEGGVK